MKLKHVLGKVIRHMGFWVLEGLGYFLLGAIVTVAFCHGGLYCWPLFFDLFLFALWILSFLVRLAIVLYLFLTVD